MKRRKGVTVFGAFALAFALLAIASYLVILFVLLPMVKESVGADNVKPLIDAFDILARNKDIIAAFSNFDNLALVPHFIVFGHLGLFLIIAIIWLIVDLRRGRKIVFFFLVTFLLACYSSLIYSLTVLPLQEFITNNVKDQPMLYVPVGGAALGVLASLFAIILFFVDLGTGRVEKEATPTFYKEPTEEVEEAVYEEVKDENEVKKEETPAPVVEEEKKEEVPEVKEEKEVLPDENKEEEVVDKAPKAKPVKKQTKKPEAKKEEKKPAAKKAEAKKVAPKKAEAKEEEKKPAPKKAEPKEETPSARKTGTIVLQNEEGKTYAKAFHVSRRPELNKWQVKATGSDKALKLFNTQKEAIEYANQLAKNQNVSVRVHSKEGKLRKHNG